MTFARVKVNNNYDYFIHLYSDDFTTIHVPPNSTPWIDAKYEKDAVKKGLTTLAYKNADEVVTILDNNVTVVNTPTTPPSNNNSNITTA